MFQRFQNAVQVLVLCALLFFFGCAPVSLPPEAQTDPISTMLEKPAPEPALQNLGYAVQVGAFSNPDNAVGLEGLLSARGIDAYYFLHEDGLYKVRFGNHPNYPSARGEAENLQAQGLIGEFFIVEPQTYAATMIQKSGKGDLREELVHTARRFIGVPYRWGGTSAENGFDCSGLTLVCYRLNGLNLPRVSYNQAKAGRWVPKSKLKKGDLVFFATNGGKKISHVGMYIGEGRFIHAPRKGKTVRIASLDNSFFKRTYMGGRTYL